MSVDTSLAGHLEAVERQFGVDVSDLAVVARQEDLKPGDIVYRVVASSDGERMYIVRHAREQGQQEGGR